MPFGPADMSEATLPEQFFILRQLEIILSGYDPFARFGFEVFSGLACYLAV
jgi:hypothetical protein